MRNLTLLLAGLIIAAIMIMPAMADTQITGAAQIGGKDNTQITTSNDQQTTGIQTGHDNTQITTSNVVNTEGGNIINGATSVSNNQQVAVFLPSNPNHYTLDTGVTTTQITSLYSGEVFVVDNDIELAGDQQMQKAGDVYQYSIKSSVPVLAYVINALDDDKVMSKSGAPTYDWVRQKYEHGWVDVTFPNYHSPKIYNHPSTLQEFNVTLPSDGRYALVIDTRVTDTLNGIQTEVTPNTIDLTYSMAKVVDGTATKYRRNVIGTNSVFKTIEGTANIDNTASVDTKF